jgi:sugar lactone lactonase YvrE
VADAGNARIQAFDAGFTFRTAWPLEEWADRLPANQPQIEALPDGRLIATDPAHSRILLINTSGQVTATLDNVLDLPLFSPNGVAFDPEARFMYITDGRAGHVRRFPFTDFALR